MSTRLYVAKEFKISYDSKSFFNGEIEELNELLHTLNLIVNEKYPKECEYMYFGDDEWDWSNATQLECEKYTWEMMTNELLQNQKEYEKAIEDYTPNEIADIMKQILNISDPTNEYIHINWF